MNFAMIRTIPKGSLIIVAYVMLEFIDDKGATSG